MNIGILTHYDVNNQGAQLQLYAMYRQLEKMGHKPVVLTYHKNYDLEPELKKRNQIGISSIPYILKHFLFEKGVGLTLHNVKKYLCNRRFRQSTFCFESYCMADIDAAIVGADEVFSLELGANSPMFGHGVNTDRMIAYAPSCGQTDLERIELYHFKELIASGLSRFHALSARDERTRDIEETFTGRTVPIVCDPVLLYEFPIDQYKLPKGTPKEDYVVVYSYDARFVAPNEIEAIKIYAKRHKLKTVSVGTYHKWCDVNIACDALQWLKCIQNAKVIITDTFHGTISAVITERPIAVFYSKTVNSSKMLDIINRLGIKDRLLNEVTADELERVFAQPYRVDEVNTCIKDFRVQSLNYLQESLK